MAPGLNFPLDEDGPGTCTTSHAFTYYNLPMQRMGWGRLQWMEYILCWEWGTCLWIGAEACWGSSRKLELGRDYIYVCAARTVIANRAFWPNITSSYYG